ncbi:MAG: hypothetical protein JWQ27_2352 [Ferruginibacter sp.]|nr:hypothetical protein [Ferruginibacter sp.]
MKTFRVLLLTFLITSAFNLPDSFNQVSVRLNYFFKLKQVTAKQYWPGFNDQLLFGPVIFYGTEGTYVVNPNKKLNTKIKYEPIENNFNRLLLGKISDKVDTSKFNMQVDYEEHDKTALYYRNPIASVSDLPLAQVFVPGIKHFEEWAGMMLHETFHQYQTSFKQFRECQNTTQEKIQRDTLIGMYKHLAWFRESVIKENQFLLNAIATTYTDSVSLYVSYYRDFKNARQQRVSKEINLSIAGLEDMLERSEGVGRYMEYCLKRSVQLLPVNEMLRQQEALYIPDAYAAYNILSDPFMNKISTQYYYTTGLNTARLLEKSHVNFQKEIYRRNLSFDYYLRILARNR